MGVIWAWELYGHGSYMGMGVIWAWEYILGLLGSIGVDLIVFCYIGQHFHLILR